MLYYDFEAGNKSYKLRLNTRNVVALEKQINCNPLAIFGPNNDSIPTVNTMVAILWQSLQTYHHGINLDNAYDIFDEWLNDGNTVPNFIAVIIEIYKVSGIIRVGGNEIIDEKN